MNNTSITSTNFSTNTSITSSINPSVPRRRWIKGPSKEEFESKPHTMTVKLSKYLLNVYRKCYEDWSTKQKKRIRWEVKLAKEDACRNLVIGLSPERWRSSSLVASIPTQQASRECPRKGRWSATKHGGRRNHRPFSTQIVSLIPSQDKTVNLKKREGRGVLCATEQLTRETDLRLYHIIAIDTRVPSQKEEKTKGSHSTHTVGGSEVSSSSQLSNTANAVQPPRKRQFTTRGAKAKISAFRKEEMAKKLKEEIASKKASYEIYKGYPVRADQHGIKHTRNSLRYNFPQDKDRFIKKTKGKGHPSKFYPAYARIYKDVMRKVIKNWVDAGAQSKTPYVKFPEPIGASNGVETEWVQLYYDENGSHIRPVSPTEMSQH